MLYDKLTVTTINFLLMQMLLGNTLVVELKKSWERKNTDNQLSVYTQLSDLYLLEIYISAS